MALLKQVIESRRFEIFIIVVIVINAITLGMETSPAIMSRFGSLLQGLDAIVLAIFVAELIARFLVYRGDFFRDPWRIFDLIVVGIALAPATAGLSVLRSLRILRVLRLISVVPSLRRVVSGFVGALPGMGSIALLLGLVFYVFAVMATKLYGAANPEYFGDLGRSAYTLFEVMTMDSWSTGTVMPLMETHPYAWIFFLPFVFLTTFAVLNLFIGVIVSAMQDEHEADEKQERSEMHSERQEILNELRALRAEDQAPRAQ